MAAIRAEHENQNRTIQGQKTALDGIITELGSLRFMGKERDAGSVAASARATPIPEMDVADNTAEGGTGATASSSQTEDKEEGEADKPSSESVLSTVATEEGVVEDDIEMGEVEENPKNPKGKMKKHREELEEGEASDSSSALSDPPDDD